MANILKRHVVYFVFDGGTTPNVDLSWSQHGIKHSTLNICLEGAPTRWASNGDSEKKIKNCLNYDEVRVRKPVIRKIICVCTHVTYRSTKIKTYKCIGNRNKCVLISLPENKTNKISLKRGFDGWETIVYHGTRQQSTLAAACIISRTAWPFLYVFHTLKSPRQISADPAQRVDYCFPICCPVKIQPYPPKPGQLLSYTSNMVESLPQSAAPRCLAWTDFSPNSTMENNQAFLLV